MVVPPHRQMLDAVITALASQGPMDEDDLADLLFEDDLDFDGDVRELLDHIPESEIGPLLQLSDGRWMWLPALLDGRVFTHRLTAAEAEHDMIVVVGADVTLLSMLIDLPTYQRLADGSPVTDVSRRWDADLLAGRGVPDDAVPPEGALLFASGRFADLGVVAGDVVGLRVTPRGFELTRVDDAPPSPVAGRIAELLAEDPGEPVELHDAVWSLCADHDETLREPTVPLDEALSAAGLVQQGDMIAPAGFDFAAQRRQRATDRLMQIYELDEDEALAAYATLQLHHQVREATDPILDLPDNGDDDELDRRIGELLEIDEPTAGDTAADTASIGDRRTIAAALALLAEPAVADAVRIETESVDLRAAAALGVLAESVEPMAPRPARPALRWLRAVAQERLGDVRQAEQTFLEAESLDPSWPLTLVWLARYASDRGDAARGLDLLRRAGSEPDHPLVQLLESFRTAPRADLGRNHPCWCGSGRKYKVCHLNREELPLSRRAAWLYHKASAHLFEGRGSAVLMMVARARSAHWQPADDLDRALADAVVADAALFEGGGFAAFLDTRGVLLPNDERLLAQQWLLIDRSVHEVVAVRRGQGMTMRDVRTGDVHEVQERTASKQVQPGQLYCGRIVPVGETMQIFGGLEPVTLMERDALVALLDDDADPVELVAFLSRRFAPPELRNTEGDVLTICEGSLRVADPVALTDGLDREYDRRDDLPDDRPGWFEHVVTHGMERIRASLELDGDELRVSANSRARFDRVLAVVQRLDPSVTVLDENRKPAGDFASTRRLAGRAPGTTPPPGVLDPATDPALAAALAGFIAQQERAWLDDSIPALAGYTPRQCAADPTRRPDLIRLLDSFPEPAGDPGMMSPARLRSALGLD